MSQQWYIRTKHGEKGPFSLQQLQGYVDARVLRQQSSIRSDQGVWIAAGTVTSLTFPANAASTLPSDPAAGPSDPAAGPSDPAAGASDPAAGPSDPAARASDPAAEVRDQVASSITELLSPVHQELQSLREQTGQLARENHSLRETFQAMHQQMQAQTELIDRWRQELKQRGQQETPETETPLFSSSEAAANPPTLRALGLSPGEAQGQDQASGARLATTLAAEQAGDQSPETLAAESPLAESSSWRDRREQAGEDSSETPVTTSSNRWRVPADRSTERSEVDQAAVGRLRSDALTRLLGPAEAISVAGQVGLSVDCFSPRQGRDFTTMVTNGLNVRDLVGTTDRRLLRSELVLYTTHHDNAAARFLSAAGQGALDHDGKFGIGTVLRCEQMPGWEAEHVLCDCVVLMSTVSSDTQPLVSEATPGVALQLYWVVPSSRAETELIESEGLHKWMSLFQAKRMSPFFDLTRPCNVKRKHWFRR